MTLKKTSVEPIPANTIPGRRAGRWCAIRPAVLLLYLAVCPPATPARAQTTDEDGTFDLADRLTASLLYSTRERDVEEHDDRHLHAERLDTSGRAELNSVTAELAFRVFPHTEAALRAGFLALDLEGFAPAGYNHSYGYGPAWGVALNTELGTFTPHRVAVKAFFEYMQAAPDSWTYHGVTPPLDYEPWIEAWRAGVEAVRETRYGAYSGGLQLSDLDIEYEHASRRTEGGVRRGGFEATHHTGVFLGAAYHVAPACELHAELHLLDTTGLVLGVSYAF